MGRQTQERDGARAFAALVVVAVGSLPVTVLAAVALGLPWPLVALLALTVPAATTAAIALGLARGAREAERRDERLTVVDLDAWARPPYPESRQVRLREADDLLRLAGDLPPALKDELLAEHRRFLDRLRTTRQRGATG